MTNEEIYEKILPVNISKNQDIQKHMTKEMINFIKIQEKKLKTIFKRIQKTEQKIINSAKKGNSKSGLSLSKQKQKLEHKFNEISLRIHAKIRENRGD